MMETPNPDKEVDSWKAQLAPAIVISCESHYGSVASLPTFPWYLEQAPNPEVKELLSRLTFATKHDVKGFSAEVSNYLERLSGQIQEKIRFKYCNHLDLVSVERKVADFKNPKPGTSKLTVKIFKGQRRSLSVRSKSKQSSTKADSGVTVEMSLDVLSVEIESEGQTVEVFSSPPKDLLAELSLERLMQAAVTVEQDLVLDTSERMSLELTVSLSESDKLEVLQTKVQRLEDIYHATDAEVARLKTLLEGVMSALDIRDEPKKKKQGYRDRGCEFCALF